jgi:glucose/arabinose dehydrogenase
MKPDVQVGSARDHTDGPRGCHRAKPAAYGPSRAASRASQCALALALASCQRPPTPHPRTPPVDQPTAAAPPIDPPIAPGARADLVLPPPFHTPSARNPAAVVDRPLGTLPTVAPGLRVTQWAKGFRFARALAVGPDGSVFVSEADGGRVSVLRDDDRDGVADQERAIFARGLDLPFGLAFHPGGYLYVGCTSRLVRFRVRDGGHVAEGAAELVLALPGRGYNQHWTRSVALSPDGARVFVGVGSETNVEVEADPRRAAITVAAADGSGARPFATGLRNPVGLAVHPDTGALFTVVNERDELGDDLAPDFLTAAREGAFYGWPFAYWGCHEDPRRAGERPDLVARAVVPDLSLGAHTAPVALAFPVRAGAGVPRGDALVSLHGSWNRAVRVGYKVVRVRFQDGRPTGEIDDWMTGLLAPNGDAWGRPMGLAELPDGSMLVMDDGAQIIWRVDRSSP